MTRTAAAINQAKDIRGTAIGALILFSVRYVCWPGVP